MIGVTAEGISGFAICELINLAIWSPAGLATEIWGSLLGVSSVLFIFGNYVTVFLRWVKTELLMRAVN